MIDTLHLDLTSYSKTFNSLSPQGQWFCSRIGKRDYPIQECNYKIIKDFITENKPKKVFCNSFYGDATEYSKIIDLSKLCKELEIELMIFTYGSNLDKNLIQELLDNNASFYLFCYGIEQNVNKIIHNVSWEPIKSFIKQTKNRCIIEYVTYKHNANDLYKLLQLCKENNNSIKITRGNTFEFDVVNIFDKKGHWLYDALRVTEDLPFENEFLHDVDDACKIYKELNLKQESLNRTSIGYLNTLHFIKNDVGYDIFDISIPDKTNEYKLNLDFNKEVFINSTGHIFCSRESYEVFNNCLCKDWSSKTQRHIHNNFNNVVILNNNLLKKDSIFMNSTVLKNVFYFNKNHEDCRVENNLKEFYWN